MPAAERAPLRDRLIAALRPRLTIVEAQMIVDQLVDEVYAYGIECATAALTDQGDAVASMVRAAQDCLEILGEPSPAPAPPPMPAAVRVSTAPQAAVGPSTAPIAMAKHAAKTP